MKEDLIYPFGYLLTREHFPNDFNWLKKNINDEWTLYYSKDNECIELDYEDYKVVGLGYFFDIRNGTLSKEIIIKNLVESINKSYESFIEDLSYLSGRYLLIICNGQYIQLYNDTAGLKPVIYHKSKLVIGSHDSLINEVLGKNLTQIYFDPNEVSFSNLTRFESVIKLIPNMTLELPTGNIKRYYPTKEYTIKTKEEIKSEIIYYLNETVKWLKSSNYKLLLSLTGGGDSRMSLAFLKPIINEVEIFTYLKDTTNENYFVQKTFRNDEKIVKSIVDNLNLTHKFFEISTDENTDPEIISTIKHNVFSKHHWNLANDYYKIYGKKNYLHIRSTALFNIGKYIYPYETLNIKEWDVELIAKYVQKWTNIEDEDKNIQHVNELIKYAQLEEYYNYNPLELLFLSYRLIQWHSGVVGESDIAFDTMLLLNARKIVDLMLSYPIEERYHNNLFSDMIDELWPILNYWEVNKTTNLKDKYNMLLNKVDNLNKKISDLKELSKFALSFIRTKTTQASEVKKQIQGNGFLFKLSDLNIKKNESYEITLDLSKLNLEGKLSFVIQFFYNNPKGKKTIYVKSNLFKKRMDIVDLFGKHYFTVDLNKDKILKISIKHCYPTSSKSWNNASRVWIGNFKIE